MSAPKRDIDVSALPTHAFGARDPVWWAVVLVIAIETTMFALLFVSYFYIRGNYDLWPVEGVGTPDLLLGTISSIVLFATLPVVFLVNRAARDLDVPRARRWVAVATLLLIAAVAIRGVEMWRIPFRWDTHAYGSVFWVALGLHTFHLLATIVEGLISYFVLRRGPVEEKFPVDVDVTGLYTYFVIASWIPTYAVLYLERTVP